MFLEIVQRNRANAHPRDHEDAGTPANLIDIMKVTNSDCFCGWLERAVCDSNLPIEFEATEERYVLRSSELRFVVFYHCPVCGGRAPKSPPHSFAINTFNVLEKFKKVRNLEEAQVVFGKPASVDYISGKSNAKEIWHFVDPETSMEFVVRVLKNDSVSIELPTQSGDGPEVQPKAVPD